MIDDISMNVFYAVLVEKCKVERKCFSLRSENMMIVAGDYIVNTFEGTEQYAKPYRLVPHPLYNRSTNNADIMLIKVPQRQCCDSDIEQVYTWKNTFPPHTQWSDAIWKQQANKQSLKIVSLSSWQIKNHIFNENIGLFGCYVLLDRGCTFETDCVIVTTGNSEPKCTTLSQYLRINIIFPEGKPGKVRLSSWQTIWRWGRKRCPKTGEVRIKKLERHHTREQSLEQRDSEVQQLTGT